MKKVYIIPTTRLSRFAHMSSILTVSGGVKEGNKLDPSSPTDPAEGEPMSAKGNSNRFWNDTDW